MRLTPAMMGAGVVTTFAGFVMRSCALAGNDLANAWCGSPPSSALLNQFHEHCAGCGFMVAGAVLMATALGLSLTSSPEAKGAVS